MKRLPSSDSLGALMSICPNSTDMDGEHNPGNNPMYSSREFQAILEGLDDEESCQVSEKKRRLSVDQVRALEKNFEVENKLEPDRKIKLARELGLQPRQVAVWFQNRRARWKTKQLERDFTLLKNNHDSLKLKFESLRRDNESLSKQIEELKSKLKEEGKISVKEAPLISGGKCKLESPRDRTINTVAKCAVFGDMKDGSSDSDSSAILNEEKSNKVIGIQYSDNTRESQLLVKIEEHHFFGEEESCSTLFCDDQAPCLNWYCSSEWNV